MPPRSKRRFRNRNNINLGGVRQRARVRLNGKYLSTLSLPPFRIVVDNLQPKDNRLEVEMTSVSANRIRDLDRRGTENFQGHQHREHQLPSIQRRGLAADRVRFAGAGDIDGIGIGGRLI
jgi:hypothetical protein